MINKLRIEVSSVCQLNCVLCPTPKGIVKKHIGNGFLSVELFEDLLAKNPWVQEVELSNWGEILLNRNLDKILKIAYEKDVVLSASNGVNFNTLPKRTLEALAKYPMKFMNCSIDGATNETYEKYRRGGNLDRVLENIRKLNELKKENNSIFPILTWQYVVFSHNHHMAFA